MPRFKTASPSCEISITGIASGREELILGWSVLRHTDESGRCILTLKTSKTFWSSSKTAKIFLFFLFSQSNRIFTAEHESMI